MIDHRRFQPDCPLSQRGSLSVRYAGRFRAVVTEDNRASMHRTVKRYAMLTLSCRTDHRGSWRATAFQIGEPSLWASSEPSRHDMGLEKWEIPKVGRRSTIASEDLAIESIGNEVDFFRPVRIRRHSVIFVP